MTKFIASLFGRAFGAVCLVAAMVQPVVGQQVTSNYQLRSGDKVTLTLYAGSGEEIPQLRGERIINRTGNIFLPLIGPTQVAGTDQEGIRTLVQSLYSDYYSDHVVQAKVELNVSISGSVRDAGQYFVSPTATIIDAINAAGGMTSEVTTGGYAIPADQSRVRLVRDGVTSILNLRPDDISLENLRMPIQSGDWIHVPNRTRSRVRDEIQFWSIFLGLITNVAAIIVLIGR